MAKEKGRWENCKTLRTNSRPCSFCKECDDVEVLFGIFYTIGKTNCHHYCLLLSSRLKQNGEDEEGIEGFLHEDIARELKRASSRTCYYCGRNNATLQCHFLNCTKTFHLPCGRRNGALNLFHDQFQSYCALHRPVQRVPTSILTSRPSVTPGSIIIQLPRLSSLPELQRLTIGEASRDVIDFETKESTLAVPEISSEWHTCGICYDKVTPLPTWNTLWPPCCKGDRWFHRICVAKLALSAGRHYVKCPLCNNQPVFLSTLLKFGFYVPDRDASWEREDGAFRELHERPKECYVPSCLSSAGRQYSGSKLWQLVICNLCGSQAAHRRCADLKLNRSLICSRCQPDQPQPQAYDDTHQDLNSSKDSFIAWREDTNSARDGRDSVISVQGSSSGSSGTCEAYLTMNNDLIIKTDKENVFSVRSIDSSIIKSLSPKKGELTTNNRSNNTILKKLLNGSSRCNSENGGSSVDQTTNNRSNNTILEKLLNGSSGRNNENGGSSVDQRSNQTERYIILNELPEESVTKTIRRESVNSDIICVDDSDNAEEIEESVKRPAPRRSIRRQSVYMSRIGVDESDSKEDSIKQPPQQRRTIRRQSVYSNRICVDESDSIEESVKQPTSRRSIRRDSVYSNKNESYRKEESIMKPLPHSSIYGQSTSSTSDNKEAIAESVTKPAAQHPMRRKSICASRFYAEKTELNKVVTRDDLEVGKRLSNENTAPKTIASYFNNPVKKSFKLGEITSNADVKKGLISSTNKYNGGKFKVKISPTSSKHKKSEKNAEQTNVSSGRDTFKDKVEKYFQQLEELRNKTTLNASPVFDTEQPLRIVLKVEGYLSKNAGAPSKKRKRLNETQSQNKKVKNNKIENKPCPKSKKLFYVENEEITDLNDKMDVEEEASIKYKIINDEYAKVITSRRVFTVPIPKCPGDKSKKKDKDKRKSAETGQTNIMSYFQTINVKKEPTTLVNTQETNDKKPDEIFHKVHSNQAVKRFADIKKENPDENSVKKMDDNSNSPSKQLDVVSDVHEKDFHEFVVNNCVELLGMSGERKPRKKMSPAARALKNDYRSKKRRKTVKKVVSCERNPVDGRYLKPGSAESELIKKLRKNGSLKAKIETNDNLSTGNSFSYKEAVRKVSPNKQVVQNNSLYNVSDKEVIEKVSLNNVSDKEVIEKVSLNNVSDKEVIQKVLPNVSYEEDIQKVLTNNVSDKEVIEKVSLNNVSDKEVIEKVSLNNVSDKEVIQKVLPNVSYEEDIQKVLTNNVSDKEVIEKVSSNSVSDKEVIAKVLPNNVFDKEVVEKVLSNKEVDQKILPNANGNSSGSEIHLKKNNVSEFEKECDDKDMEGFVEFCDVNVLGCEKGDLANNEKGDLVPEMGEMKKLNEERGEFVNDSEKKRSKSEQDDIVDDIGKNKSKNEKGDLVNVRVGSEDKSDAALIMTCDFPVSRTDLDKEIIEILQNVDVDEFINGSEISGETWHVIDEIGESDESFINNDETVPEKRYSNLSKDGDLRTLDEVNVLNKGTEEQNIDEINVLNKVTEEQNIDEINILNKVTEEQNIDEINILNKGTEEQNIDEIYVLNKGTEEQNIDEINDLTKDAGMHNINEINDLSKDENVPNTGVIDNKLLPTTVLQKNYEINYTASGSSLPKSGNPTKYIQNSDKINDIVTLLDDPQDEIVSLLYDSDTPNNDISELNNINKQTNDEIVSLVGENNDEVVSLVGENSDEIVTLVGENNDETVSLVGENNDECILILEDDDDEEIITSDESNKILKENILNTNVDKNDTNFLVKMDDLIKNTIGKMIQDVNTINLCNDKEKNLNKSKNDLSKSSLSKKYNDSKTGYSTNSSFSVHGNVLKVRRHAKHVIKLETPYVEEIIESDDLPNTTTNDTTLTDDLLNKNMLNDYIKVDKVKRYGLFTRKDSDVSITQEKNNGNKNDTNFDNDCVIVNNSENTNEKGVDGNTEPNLTLDEDCVIVDVSKKRKRKHQKFKNQDGSLSETDVMKTKNKNSGFVVNNALPEFISIKSANETPSFSQQGFRRDFWKVTSYSNMK